jgi:AcrR family transcriptional regulator
MMKRKPREVREKEILDAAIRCFSKKGYHETTMDDIVAESGLTKGGIYWYFKGKREVFIVLIEEQLREEESLWEELSREYELGSELMIKAGHLYLQHHLEDEQIAPLVAEFMAESYRDEKIRRKMNEHYAEWQKIIKGAFDQAIQEGKMKGFNSGELSLALTALLGGLINQCWVSNKKVDYIEVWSVFCQALLEGIQR